MNKLKFKLLFGTMTLSATVFAGVSPTSSLIRPRVEQDSRLSQMASRHIPSLSGTNSGASAKGMESRLRGFTHKYPYGLQAIPMQSNQNYTMLCTDVSATYGGVEANGIYYAVDRMAYGAMTPYFMAFNTSDWSVVQDQDATYNILADDLTFDPVTQKIYGCFFTSSDPQPDSRMFGYVDFSTGTRTDIAPLKVAWNAIAANADGIIYAIDAFGVLHTVDKTTGAMTRVGDTGLKPKYLSSAAFDFDTGKLYYILSNDGGCIMYEIDPRTARATERMVYDYDQEITGIYFVSSGISAEAPGAVSNLSASFPEGELSGTVSFVTPAKTHSGAALSGNISYHIIINGTEIASATSSPSEKIVENVTLSSGGECEISVICSNEAGEGDEVSITVFVGPEVPVAPENVVAEYADGRFTVSWSPVSKSQNNEYINPSTVTYNVVRYPDREVVASGISVYTVTDKVAETDDYVLYSYGVSASANGMTGPQAISNHIALGALNITADSPYQNDFDSDDSLNGLTLIDANADDFAWTLKDGAAYLPFAYYTGGDDWMILPAMNLEQNHAYRVRMFAYGFSTECTERVEVKMGISPSAEAMTTEVIEPTELNRNITAPMLIEGYVFPESTGRYHIGIHGISDPNQWGLYIDNVTVEQLASAGVPAAVSGLSVVPDFNGVPETEISFTLPSVDIEGEPLSSLTKALVLRDNIVIKEFDNPIPGETLTFTDKTAVTGEHLYEVLAATEAGEGRISSARVFVGINMPGFPTQVEAREVSEGKVTIAWVAPETDIDGYPMNSALVNYRVAEVVGGHVSRYIADNLSGTEFTYQFVAPGSEQQMMQWAVEAFTSAGSRSGIPTDMLSVGKPYDMPFLESFADGELAHPMGALNLAGKGAWTLHQEQYSIYPSQDNDGGFIAMYGTEGGESQALFTGKIMISGSNPLLTYWIGNFAENNNNSLGLQIDNGSGWQDVRLDVLSDLTETGWNLVAVDLSEYIGSAVRLRFIGNIVNYSYIPLDNISISERPAVNLAVGNLIIPKEIAIGSEFEIKVPVTNTGASVPANCRIILHGDVDKYVDFEAPDVMQRKEIVVKAAAPVCRVSQSDSSIKYKYYAELEVAGDAIYDDNISSEVEVSFLRNALPMPSDVVANIDNYEINISWSKPDLSLEPRDIIEDFEEHIPFAINNIPGWNFIDGDNGFSTGFSNSEFPGMNSKMAFILLDTAYEGFVGNSYASHSGTKHLAAFTAPFENQNDDWAILPVLSGEAQEISFYAKSYGGSDYPETFEVYTSENENASIQSDFTILGSPTVAATSWTRYSYNVPKSTRRFAIRYASQNQFVLFIDDVCYQAAGPGYGLQLAGYNVYVDHKRVNETPITDTTHSLYFNSNGMSDLRIEVSAVYNSGESTAEFARIDTSDVNSLMSDNLRVYSSDGRIIIETNKVHPVSVYTPDGRRIAQIVKKGTSVINVERGLYIVDTGEYSRKLIVE